MRVSSDENNSCFMPLIVFIPNFFINLFYILNILDYLKTSFDINSLIRFTMFGAFISTIATPFSAFKSFNEECVSYAKEKALPYTITTIVLLIYSFLTIILFDDRTITFSAFIMTYSFFLISYHKKNEFAKRQAEDYKIRWQKKNSGVDIDSQDPNIFWRFKLWFYPKVKLPRHRRPNLITNNLFFLIVAVVTIKPIPIISLLALGYLLVYFIEYIFSLYVETKGFCTEAKYCTGRKSNDKWKITIVDYVNKRKIVFYSATQPYFANGDYVRVVTGIFTKKVVTCSTSSRTTY